MTTINILLGLALVAALTSATYSLCQLCVRRAVAKAVAATGTTYRAELRDTKNKLELERLNRRAQQRHATEALEMQQAEHDKQVAALKAHIGATLSAQQLQLVADMAGKLRLASNALHATQAFKDAREAKELAVRGQLMLDSLKHNATAEQEAA